jgi:hypothetical protein
MKLLRTALIAAAAFAGANAFAVEYTMSCDDALATLDRELSAEGQERFANLQGACMGVVERDGELFAHTELIVRRVRGGTVTLYLPATDRTFDVQTSMNQRVKIGSNRVRTRDLNSGQTLNLYINVNEFTQPVVREVAFETEDEDDLVVVPAVAVAALPTTG